MAGAKLSQKDMKLSCVSTEHLKESLNNLYESMHRKNLREKSAQASLMVTPGLFDYLWDLKELALLEGQRSVEVPEPWLEELEVSCHDMRGKRRQ